jgi:hypothetical protein
MQSRKNYENLDYTTLFLEIYQLLIDVIDKNTILLNEKTLEK